MDHVRYAAEYLDGETAVARSVTVTLDLAGLQIEEAGTGAHLALWAYGELALEVVSSDLAQISHRLTPNALLTSRDAALAAALIRRDVRAARAHGGRRIRLAAFYGGAIALFLGLLYLSLPVISRAIARRVPLTVEAKLTLPLDELLGKQTCTGPDVDAALAALVARLRLPGDPAPGANAVRLVNFAMVNALTFPGGRVMITRGLVEEAGSPDELAGVLAHELEHVRQRHIMAHLVRATILSSGWAMTVGDFSGLMVVDPVTLFNIATRSFSRDDERAADQGALARLDAAGVSRAGLSSFFTRMKRETDVVPAWLSTHPLSEERIRSIGGRAPGARPTTPALGESQWRALRQACAARKPVEGNPGTVLDPDKK